VLKFLLEHRLPRRLRYAKVYFQAGSASVFFSLDGASARWNASIGRARRDVAMTDVEYARLRQAIPAKELLDDDGREVVIRNADGEEERWAKPRWVLRGVHRKPASD
jgi:hypothetical protein